MSSGQPPQADQREAHEVDPRYTLANERTLLAWVRTSLALIAAGLAIIEFFEGFELPGARRLLGLVLILLGSVVALASGWEWQTREHRMREGRAILPSHLGWVITAGVVVAGVVAIVLAVAG